ncbi:hypothetical protein [Amycolatopsis sp. BJA-103]|nr:hypothetical protein [Amycolatopsis sp. BJA-103]
MWNFQPALRSRGLGPLPVTYTTVPDFKPASRVPLSDVAYLDGWGDAL